MTDESQIHGQGRDPRGVAAAMQAAIRDEGPQFALPLVIANSWPATSVLALGKSDANAAHKYVSQWRKH